MSIDIDHIEDERDQTEENADLGLSNGIGESSCTENTEIQTGEDYQGFVVVEETPSKGKYLFS